MSRIKLILPGLLIFVLLAFKDGNVAIPRPPEQKAKKDTIVISTPEKLTVQMLSNQNSIGFDWSKNMPWIGAIVIGLTTVAANLIISKLSRSSSILIAEKQMELTKKNSERDFKKTVISANRQSWINDFRTNISDLISLTIVLATEQKFESENHLKLLQLVTKAELMLSTEENHVALAELLSKLKICCTDIISGNSKFEDLENIIKNVKLLTLEVINAEWQKSLNAE